MMKEIKYKYCLDKETEELICIDDLNKEDRYTHTYICLECGNEMETNMGTKNRWYFSHKSGTACNGESYLHKLAKKRIKLKFDTSETFPVVFKRDVPCSEINKCIFKDDFYCKYRDKDISIDLKQWGGKALYDVCEEEVWTDGFKPDLRLTSSFNPNIPPIFIEIFKTHESSDKKISSGYKIIETFRLKSEEDIDDIINRGFVEKENCTTTCFEPEKTGEKKNDIEIIRVIINRNYKARFILHGFNCGMINLRADPQSVLELNVLTLSHVKAIYPNMNLNPSQIGLAFAEKKGMPIRNCMLCDSYRFNEYYNKSICVKYKFLALDSPFPQQEFAEKCGKYRHSQYIESLTLADLQKVASEVQE